MRLLQNGRVLYPEPVLSAAFLPTIAAVLTTQERIRVEAAGSSYCSLIHRNSLREAIRLVRERPVDALLLSVDQYSADGGLLLEQFGRAFPAIPTVALLTRRQEGDHSTLLRLGSFGVRQVVDLTVPSGWRQLQGVLSATATERSGVILRPILDLLNPLSKINRRFWEELVQKSPTTVTVQALAGHFNMIPTSFTSRFVRFNLPTPKEHLVGIRLCHAARLFDEGDHSVSDVAYRLQYASPQSLARHLRLVLGITPQEFRARFPFNLMLERFLDGVVHPHRETWRRFRALSPGRRDVSGLLNSRCARSHSRPEYQRRTDQGHACH